MPAAAKYNIRPARKEDAPQLAFLINLAGEGLPAWMWQSIADMGQKALDVGIARASRETGSFSYRNAFVIADSGTVDAMLLGYKQPAHVDLSRIGELPEPIKPLVQLEALAPNSWYVNGLATDPQQQAKGMGNALLDFAEELALNEALSSLSLIVAGNNRRAKTLYEKKGYRLRASLPMVPFSEGTAPSQWELFIKQL